ncbi:MAG: hypothetical protein NVS2B3_12050 [Vulcanimicrobiaceae bacterium]
MHVDVLDALARHRIDRLTMEAAAHRALRRPSRTNVRRALGRAVRAIGYAFLTLGDALARSHESISAR